MSLIIDEIFDLIIAHVLDMQRGRGNERGTRSKLETLIEQYELLGRCGTCSGSALLPKRDKKGELRFYDCIKCSGTGRRGTKAKDKLLEQALKRMRWRSHE